MSRIDETTPSIMISRYVRLFDVARDLASTLDLDELLRRIVRAAADVANATAASLLLYDESNNEFFFQASTDLDTHLLRGSSVPVEKSVAGKILEKSAALILKEGDFEAKQFEDLNKNPRLEIRSVLGVPLILNDKVVGVLEAVNRRRGQFSIIDQQILFALGAQAAVGIENARLFQQSDLISELVHELRTPLASIRTAAHLLQRPETSDRQRASIAETIQKESDRLSEMAASFLDLARLESGRAPFNLQEVEMVGLLREAAEIMQNRIDAHRLKLHWETPESLPSVQGDRNQLKQVALNLLSNAIKYNRPSGEITISASLVNGGVAFSVSDNGPGILPEHLPRLFERFYRVPNAEHTAYGTGLGLSICRRIVNTHGGKIRADSQVGKGTSFTVSLPLAGETGG